MKSARSRRRGAALWACGGDSDPRRRERASISPEPAPDDEARAAADREQARRDVLLAMLSTHGLPN